jgi:hypothetical protein
MNYKNFVSLFLCLGFISLGCSKSDAVEKKLTLSEQGSVLMKASGAQQIDGISYFDATDACGAVAAGAAYAINMTGSLEGCLLTFVDEYECSPSGTYREIGREHFIGTYMGEQGEFWTTYKFEAKYEGCAENGSYIGLEIKGRCQHPITEGSGTGIFEGATGRLDMKDDIEAGNYPYRGHFKLAN